MKNNLFSIILFLSCINTYAQQTHPLISVDSLEQKMWVDAIMKDMTIDEKIGQLFMVAAYSNKNESHKKYILDLIDKYHIGSLIFFQDDPLKQAALTNSYQAASKIPLLIGIDGEWGLNMRLKNTYRFPWNMTLGAVQNNTLIKEFGAHVGAHCNRLGIHMNFGPVVDVNTNPENPIIGNRSFGEDPHNVAQKAIDFMKGMQSKQVIASAKHFPGHGDTSTDSHHTLPVVDFSKKRIDSIELVPYKKLISEGLTGVMVAHLSIPSIEQNNKLPSSLSYAITTDLLQNELGFDGLIITDALNMKGSANFASSEEINLAAILAGNDILDVPLEIPKSFEKFRNALQEGVISEERLDHSVRKILNAKYWTGLHTYEPIDTTNLISELNPIESRVLHRKLVEESLTLIKNSKEVYPIKNLDNKRIGYVSLGDADGDDFLNMLQKYAQVDKIQASTLDKVMSDLKSYDLVIVGFHKSNDHPWKSYKFKNQELVWLQEIAREKRTILSIFTSPYSLLKIRSFSNIESIQLAYQNSKIAQELAAQAIFGALNTGGKLPVSINESFPVGHGISSNKLGRLAYGMPEEVGMHSDSLLRIDSLMQGVLKDKMTPGAQILAARKGKVFYHKAFGHHTDQKKREVKLNDKYDVASLTKILATLPLIMELKEMKLIHLDSTLGTYIPYLKNSNKEHLTLRNVFSHNAKLKAWVPLYTFTLDSLTNKPSEAFFSEKYSNEFPLKVADAMYLRKDGRDSIQSILTNLEQRERNGYKYSDLPFYFFKDYLESLYNQDLNVLTQDKFYKKLGTNNTTFNPIDKFSLQEIVPTEKDEYFRNQLVHGYVHDSGAALQGGIGGHAGLFSNANDVAKIMQMYLQGGHYGGTRYFESSTIDTFNQRYFADDEVRRGLVFDKPQIKEREKATCDCVSERSFGHSGFTGTYAWADPDSEIVYVFLSNRVYPNAENDGLVDENIRTLIQSYIQGAIID